MTHTNRDCVVLMLIITFIIILLLYNTKKTQNQVEAVTVDVVCTKSGKLPHPFKCNYFYSCTKGELPILLQCRDPDHEFDPVSKTCVNITYRGCYAKQLPKCPEMGRLPHPTLCSYFQMCYNIGQMPILVRCTTNFEFNPLTGDCNLISDDGCTANQQQQQQQQLLLNT
nr:Ac150 [Cnaphalocrocis medinalis granulovirus]